MIPEGRYKCRATEGALSETNDGKPQVAVDIVITEEECDYTGQHRTWYGSFTEKSQDRTLQSLRLLGWQGDDLSNLVGLGDTEAWVTIAHEEDQEGNTRDRAAWINGSGGLQVKKLMDEGAAKAFAERMKGHVLAHNAKSGAGGSSPNAAASGKPAAAAASGKPSGAGGGKKKNAPAKQQPNDFAPEDGDRIPF